MKRSLSNLFQILITVVLFCSLSISAGAQNRSIKGTVSDKSGEPVTGATILQSGSTTNGVVTDIDGHFTISVPSGSKINISCIGYKS